MQAAEAKLLTYDFGDTACLEDDVATPEPAEDVKPVPADQEAPADEPMQSDDCKLEIKLEPTENTNVESAAVEDNKNGNNPEQSPQPILKRRPGRPPLAGRRPVERTRENKPSSERNESKRAAEDQQIRDFFKMSCDICRLNFQTMREAMRHYRKNHQQAGYLVCCEKKFFRRCLALDHIRLHINPSCLQ